MAALKEILSDPRKRIESLYKIITKGDGDDDLVVRFVPNVVQSQLIDALWHRNLVLKARQRGISYEQALAERIATIPAGRIGDAEDFGAACAWLCSAQAGFIAGQNWLIDGGAYSGTF